MRLRFLENVEVITGSDICLIVLYGVCSLIITQATLQAFLHL